MGVALGCLGLSYDDFCALSPFEFYQAHKAWTECETERLHGEWERARVLATISVQPHLKKAMDPRRLIPLPWDKKTRNRAPSTRRRFDEVVRKTKDYVDNQHNIQTTGESEGSQGPDQ